MRMRGKPWARPELAKCEFYFENPQENIGKWNTYFKKQQPLHMELGCGKGTYISQLASSTPEINYIAVDIKSEVLVLAKRKIEEEYEKKKLPFDNIALVTQDIERIFFMMSPADQVERIYINFCNPWPKPKHYKKRLTHVRQLEKYKEFLAPDGEIHFKTDDDKLFYDSVKYMEESGFTITYQTFDLHQANIIGNIETEHERMFADQGIKIKFLIAQRNPK